MSSVTSRSFNLRILGWDLGVPPRTACLPKCVVRFACFIALLFTIGCGGEDLPPPERLDSHITIIDDSGTEREIPSSSLIDEETGKPVAKQVWVVDRQSSQTQFLDIAKWQEQSPSQMRYVPVSKSQPK